VTSFVAVITRLNPVFIDSLKINFDVIASMLIYVIPGVLLGGQIGPIIAKKLNLKSMKIYVSLLLVIIGVLMLVRGVQYF